eukprot:COSAG02_NODE_1471_length_12452_cov_7.724358_3_plen_56_part_00
MYGVAYRRVFDIQVISCPMIRLCHSRVKTMMPIYLVIREKKQRFEVIRRVQCIYQ